MIVQPEPPMLMLGLNQQGPVQFVGGQIYQSLLTYGADLSPQPSLAMRFDADCVDLVRRAVAEGGYSSMELLTEAGHDAMHVADYLPTAMIFTPCEGGLSHNEAENVTLADIEPGVNVLLQAVLDRAGREG